MMQAVHFHPQFLQNTTSYEEDVFQPPMLQIATITEVPKPQLPLRCVPMNVEQHVKTSFFNFDAMDMQEEQIFKELIDTFFPSEPNKKSPCQLEDDDETLRKRKRESSDYSQLLAHSDSPSSFFSFGASSLNADPELKRSKAASPYPEDLFLTSSSFFLDEISAPYLSPEKPQKVAKTPAEIAPPLRAVPQQAANCQSSFALEDCNLKAKNTLDSFNSNTTGNVNAMMNMNMNPTANMNVNMNTKNVAGAPGPVLGNKGTSLVQSPLVSVMMKGRNMELDLQQKPRGSKGKWQSVQPGERVRVDKRKGKLFHLHLVLKPGPNVAHEKVFQLASHMEDTFLKKSLKTRKQAKESLVNQPLELTLPPAEITVRSILMREMGNAQAKVVPVLESGYPVLTPDGTLKIKVTVRSFEVSKAQRFAVSCQLYGFEFQSNSVTFSSHDNGRKLVKSVQ